MKLATIGEELLAHAGPGLGREGRPKGVEAEALVALATCGVKSIKSSLSPGSVGS